MSKNEVEFKEGDLVRVIPGLVHRYSSMVRKQVEGRVGRVRNSFMPAGRTSRVMTVGVYWLNRRTRAENGNVDYWLANELELASCADAAPQAPTEPAGGVIEQADRMDEKQP